MAFTSITLNPGSGGSSVATQTIGGIQHQSAALTWGVDSTSANFAGIGLGVPTQICSGTKPAFRVAVSGVVPVAAGATDLIVIGASSTKTIKINSLVISGTASTAVTIDVLLVKRSTLTVTGGATATTPTVVAMDSGDTATGVVTYYTVANPTLGSAIGTIGAKKLALIVPGTPTGAIPSVSWDFNGRGGKPITLLAGGTQMFSVWLNTQAITGGLLDFELEFTEE